MEILRGPCGGAAPGGPQGPPWRPSAVQGLLGLLQQSVEVQGVVLALHGTRTRLVCRGAGRQGHYGTRRRSLENSWL